MKMGSLIVAPRGAARYKIRKAAKASVAAILGTALFAQIAIADGNNNPGSGNSTPDSKTWAGIGWGLGVAADFDLGGKRVANAEIVNGNIVRVTDTSSNVGVSFVLEAHYFFKDWQFGYSNGKCALAAPLNLNCNNVATGPFVAIEIGGGTSATTNAGPITGYALGWMVGLHHPSASATSSWNFGVGFRVDPQAKVLGDGFVANQPPPPGETSVRFKTEPRYGKMLLSSFSF
jgi:hypothetical protein